MDPNKQGLGGKIFSGLLSNTVIIYIYYIEKERVYSIYIGHPLTTIFAPSRKARSYEQRPCS